VKATSHKLPDTLSPKLDLRLPPHGRPSRHHARLAELLAELGSALDAQTLDQQWLHTWEHSVLALIDDGEIDLFMRPPEAPEFSLADLPEQRWLNLKHILMRRKGLAT
jgi:hypothetical protein